jgi:hypothetical protein
MVKGSKISRSMKLHTGGPLLNKIFPKQACIVEKKLYDEKQLLCNRLGRTEQWLRKGTDHSPHSPISGKEPSRES